MRWFLILFTLAVLAIPVGLGALAVFCTQSDARVEGDAILSGANVERAKKLLHEHDPRKLRSGETKTVRMNEEELSLVLNHLIKRAGNGGAALDIQNGSLNFIATLDLSTWLPGRFLNIDALVNEVDGQSRIENLKIGDVSVPPGVVGAVAAFAAEHIYRASGVHNAGDIIQAVEIQPQHLAITYEWKAGIVDAFRDRIISPDDREKLRFYNAALAAEVKQQADALTFASLLEAIFRIAGERAATSDPVAENRAAVTVMAAYINGRGLTALVPEAAAWVKPDRRRLRLRGRRDFVQHFMTSAALAVAGGDAVANAIGLFKEVDDADGGSGFSFRDLAADMAGTEFGKYAVADSPSARLLQQRVAAGIDDAAIMPSVEGLEENLNDEQFVSAFGGVGGSRYTEVVADIEQRIALTPLYRH